MRSVLAVQWDARENIFLNYYYHHHQEIEEIIAFVESLMDNASRLCMNMASLNYF